jgi:hypothetical protein
MLSILGEWGWKLMCVWWTRKGECNVDLEEEIWQDSDH